MTKNVAVKASMLFQDRHIDTSIGTSWIPGLMSYGPNLDDVFRRAAVYVDAPAPGLSLERWDD